MIEFRQVSFSYTSYQGQPKPVFEGLTFSIPSGRYAALMGPNGSGKSTLGKLVKGLLFPSSGQVFIEGVPLKAGEISSLVGYIFSNPENQIVSSVVEEDVAFGPANLGVDPSTLAARVTESLRTVGMEKYRHHPPHLLSGGQQQKVVIAGILAMDCEVLVLDEPTSMLDPQDRQEILAIFKKIHEKGPRTLLHITHSFEEALMAQDFIYLDPGRIIFHGTPEEFLSVDHMPEASGIEIPPLLQVVRGLRERGHNIPPGVRTYDQLKEFLLEGNKKGL
jgi:energy-coupling factor transport system ATP-binding protein